MKALSTSIPNGGPEIVHEDWVSSCIDKGEVVNENDEGILSIEYSKMMGLIVEAIKELNVKIDLIK